MAKPRDESFYKRLTNLFSSGPVLRRRIKGRDPKNFYDNSVVHSNLGYYGGSSFKRDMSPFSIQGAYGLLDRMSRYAEFESMEQTAEVNSALDLYSSEICSGDEKGKSFHVFSDNPQIQKALEELFEDIYNIEFEGMRDVRNLIKNGDFFRYVEVAPQEGVVNVEPIPVNEIEREEGFDPSDPYAIRFKLLSRGGKYLQNWQMLHFRILGSDRYMPYGQSVLDAAVRPHRQLCYGPETKVWLSNKTWKYIPEVVIGDKTLSYDIRTKQLIETKVKNCTFMGIQKLIKVKTAQSEIVVTPNHGLLVWDSQHSNFFYKQAQHLECNGKDLLVQPANHNSSSDIMLLPPLCIVECGENKTYDLEIDHECHNFVADGIVGHNSMMEDAMLVYRIVRAPERRAFHIDVTGLNPNDIPQYMEAVKETIRGSSAIDRATGREDFRYNALSIQDDIFLPTKINSQTKIDSLPGGANAAAVEDVEYIRNKLISALKVPKAYIQYSEGTGSKATLSQLDIRFSRTISSLQKIMVAELNKLAILHLYAKGFNGEDLLDFELRFSNPSTVALQQKLALIGSKIDIAGKAWELSKETGIMDTEYIQKEILGFRMEEIVKMRIGSQQDQIRIAQLRQLAEATPKEDKDGEAIIDPFDPDAYKLPGGNSSPQQLTNNQDGTQRSKIKLPEPSSDNLSSKLMTNKKLPISPNPTPNVTKLRRQATRNKEFTGRDALAMPDFNKMLDPNNRQARDPFDYEYLKSPLKEDVFSDFLKERAIPIGISKDVISMLKRFDEANRKNLQVLDLDILSDSKIMDSDENDEMLLLENELFEEKRQTTK